MLELNLFKLSENGETKTNNIALFPFTNFHRRWDFRAIAVGVLGRLKVKIIIDLFQFNFNVTHVGIP